MKTVETTTAPEPTYNDLSAAVTRLATQVADLTSQVAHERTRAATNAALADRLYVRLDEMHTELRRVNEDRWRLARRAEAFGQQIDRMQAPRDPRPDDHTRRWPFRRIGNAL